MRRTAIEVERLFQCLAERTRLRLLNLMAGREVCVCFFVEVLGLPQPMISRHLAYLRRSGVVTARREGKWIHYRIAVPQHPCARRILRETLQWFAQDKQMRADRALLRRASCSATRFVTLQSAPPPMPLRALAAERMS